MQALKDGSILDCARLETLEEKAAPKEHPLVTLFNELQQKFDAAAVEKPTSFVLYSVLPRQNVAGRSPVNSARNVA